MTLPVRKAAYTLIEMVVVMSIGSVIMLTSVSWIHRSMTLSKQLQVQQDHQTHLMRLAQVFRSDVRNAAAASIDNDRLTLTPPTSQPEAQTEAESGTEANEPANRQVQYQVDGSRVHRSETTETGQLRHESFLLAAGSGVYWLADDLPGSVGIQVLRSSNTPQPSRVSDQHVPQDDLRLRIALDRYRTTRRQP